MITTESELEIARKQLALAEGALDSLRRELKHKNERNYQVLAETTIDLVRSIRDDIDAYLGTSSVDRQNARVVGVVRRVDLDDLTFVLRERPDGLPDLLCEYSKDEEKDVIESLGRAVEVTGRLETSRKTGKQKLDVEFLELVPVQARGEETVAEQPTAPVLSAS